MGRTSLKFQPSPPNPQGAREKRLTFQFIGRTKRLHLTDLLKLFLLFLLVSFVLTQSVSWLVFFAAKILPPTRIPT